MATVSQYASEPFIRRYEIKWYRKPSSRDIIINCHSEHPKTVKIHTVRNKVETARSVSSNKYRDDATNRARKIAKTNGYKPHSLLDRIIATMHFKNAPCVRILFISKSFCSKVQKIFLKHGFEINVVAKPHPL